MKPVLAWVKSNLVIVICSLVIVAVLPACWFGSDMWGKKILAARQKEADAQLSKMKAQKVTYTIPGYLPGDAGLSLNTEPNSAITAYVKQQRDAVKAKADALVQKADNFNKGVGPDAAGVGRSEHVPLVAGLFPKAEGDFEKKADALEDKLLGKNGQENPYVKLLQGIRAGGAADVALIRDDVMTVQQRETEKITTVKRELKPEEAEQVRKAMSERRMAKLQGHAQGLSVFATMDNLPRQGTSAIPRGSSIDPAALKSPTRLFLYQWDYWALSDLLSAVRVANTGPDGKLWNVDRAPVKRIVSIELDPIESLVPSEEGMGREGTSPDGMVAAAAGDAGGLVAVDPSVSITGRVMGPSNKLYDLRTGVMVVIVDSARVNELLTAIPRTNFLSVTKLDLADVDPWADMRQGYYYGESHVVRATIRFEGVWLRSWMEPLMPAEVKKVLVGEDPNAAPAGGG